MTYPRGLMGLGLAAQLAKRLGLDSSAGGANLNGGAAFATAAAIGQFQFYVRANAQTGAATYQLPPNAEIGSEYTIFNLGGITGGVTANVYPPVGGTINVAAGATATLTAIVSGKSAFFVAVTASTFDAFLTA
jgi:hypothetical protein